MKARPLTLILEIVAVATWTTVAEAQLRPAIAPVAPGGGFGGGLGAGLTKVDGAHTGTHPRCSGPLFSTE
jgi:hypothetical protein